MRTNCDGTLWGDRAARASSDGRVVDDALTAVAAREPGWLRRPGAHLCTLVGQSSYEFLDVVQRLEALLHSAQRCLR